MATRGPCGGEGATGGEIADPLGGAFQQVMLGLLRMQEALSVQEEEAQRRAQEALRLQEQMATTALHQAVRMMQQERDQAIRDLREEFSSRMERLEERMNRAEERMVLSVRGPGSEVLGEKGMLEQLEGRMGNLEVAIQRALSTVFPRVEALVALLEKTTPPEAPTLPPVPAASSTRPSTSTSITTSASASTSNPTSTSVSRSTRTRLTSASCSPRPPAASELRAAGAREEPDVGHQDAATRDEERVRQRLELHRLEVMARRDRAEATPSPLEEELCVATREGRLGEVRRLLDLGADVNYIDSNGNFPLLYVALSCAPCEKLVALLLERGADPNAMNPCGSTALHLATMSDRSGRVVTLLLGAGADVNARDEDGIVPLLWAAYSNNKAVVSLLLAAGARKNLKSWSGAWRNMTPLDATRSSVVRELLRRGRPNPRID